MFKHAVVCITLIFLSSHCIAQSPLSICSWNLKDFGNSKNEVELSAIADLIAGFDIIAIQEIVAGQGGPEAVMKLVKCLCKNGTKWTSSISPPTSSASKNQRERYAYIWKPGRVRMIGNAWLDRTYEKQISREPYMALFSYNNKKFTAVSFHAIPKSRQPETEIKYLKLLPGIYPAQNLLIMGDFNCPQSHTVFNPLKGIGYQPAFIKQRTSLRQKCLVDGCLASEYDNIFYNPSHFTLRESGIVHFYKKYSSLKEARKISDHVPVYLTFVLK